MSRRSPRDWPRRWVHAPPVSVKPMRATLRTKPNRRRTSLRWPLGDQRVAMAALEGAPNLSALLAWPTDHLTEAAAHWETVGERSYVVAHQVWRDAASVDWRGEAADALRSATHADLQATSAAVDQLHAATRVARSGASDLYAARSRVRYAVEDARTAGFEVGEDLSVTDRMVADQPRSGPPGKPQRRPSPAKSVKAPRNWLASINKLPAKSPPPWLESATRSRKNPPLSPLCHRATAISTLSIASGNQTVAKVNRIPGLPGPPAVTISVGCLTNSRPGTNRSSRKCVQRKTFRIYGSGRNSTAWKVRMVTVTPAKGPATSYPTARR